MITYRATSGATRQRQLNDFVLRKNVNASSREERLGSAGAAQDLEQDRDGRLVEDSAVHAELETSEVEQDIEVEIDVRSARLGDTRGSGIGKGMKVSLKQGGAIGGLRRGRVGVRGASIAQDSGVDTSDEASSTNVRVRADPVVAHRPVGAENEGVALARENLDAVDCDWHYADAVDFDHGLPSSVSLEKVSWQGYRSDIP